MELGGREILIALGALLMVAIMLDGFRRVRRAGKGKLRVKRRRQPIFDDDDFDEFGSELPNGKARVISFRDEDSAEQLSQTIRDKRASDESRLTAPFRKPGQEVAFDDQDSELDSAQAAVPQAEATDFVGSQTVEANTITPEPVAGEEVFDTLETPEASEDRARKQRETQFSLFGEAVIANIDDDLQARPITAEKDGESHESRPAKVAKKARSRKKAPREKPTKSRVNKRQPSEAKSSVQSNVSAKPRQSDIDDDVVILHLMAEQGQMFQGDDLLKAVVDNGLRYGSLKIFHRHVHEDGSGDVLFSMANSVNPGTFDLNAMGEFSTPGVTFMMVMSDSEDPLGTFDLMLASIHGVNSAIGGELKDQQRSALSRQTAEHYRQRIMDFNRRRLAAGA